MGELMVQLKAKHPRAWMTVTNREGVLVPKCLKKLCEKEGLPVEQDTESLLQALLDLPSLGGGSAKPQGKAVDSGEDFLRQQFRKLCISLDIASEPLQLSLCQWLSWDWLAARTGPSGIITSDASSELWRRVVGCCDYAGEEEFVALGRALQEECGFATTIQSFLRGCSDRQKAHSEAQAQQTSDRCGIKLAPYNPTPDCAICQALDAFCVKPDDVLYDLGCGDGRLLIAAAQLGARAVGVEYDPRFAEKAKLAVQDAGLSELATVICGDAFAADLTPASKIFVYLVPDGLRRMQPALTAAIKRGVPIASYTFSMPGWTAHEVLTAETRSTECKVWVYRNDTCLPSNCESAPQSPQGAEKEHLKQGVPAVQKCGLLWHYIPRPARCC